ncbi:MAG: TRAP transporter substrate-binding protein DctP [Micromonosporaceae bacterium]
MATNITRRQMLRTVGAGVAGGVVLGASGCSEKGVLGGNKSRLRLSHQWPNAKNEDGDFRAWFAQEFARKIGKETDGEVEIKVFPAASLVEAEAQYEAMRKGTIDMTVYPVVYAVGDHPAFDVTALPCLIQNHTQAQNWQKSKLGARVEAIFEEAGTKILAWNWDSLCLGVKGGPPVVRPDDIEDGAVWRGASPLIEKLLQKAGASITSMDSSEVYNAMQTGTLDGFITSPSSYRSYRLYEQTSAYTSPTENTVGFFFEPLLIGLDQFKELPKDVQTVFEDVGAQMQKFAFGASEEDDLATEQKAADSDVTVKKMDDAALAEWKQLSEPLWAEFAEKVPNGAELVDMAKNVPAE